MEKLFGLPIDTVMVALLILFGLAVGAMAVVALRDPVILKMAVRNIPRRPAQSSLHHRGAHAGHAALLGFLLDR